ncbi:hypothetical protein OAT67_01530 [Bacteriovoracaceae bacterium]|nr:hypothetical protein [Bacteriovoracaceae bacterium]|tara:strand:+ start:43814 stop:44509 length:696 start_codon:yes stop_codon:yes gene_type:complete
MLSSKFRKIILILISICNLSLLAYTDNECLGSSYNVTIKHKGQPFGLAENILTVEKDVCILKVSHQQLKFLNKSWMIDVCREPVHIKGTKGAVEIIKKTNGCSSRSTDEFCGKFKTLRTLIEDDGLIFAEGNKENIESDHGKVYCSYQLLNAYLDRDFVFSSSRKYADVLNAKKKEVEVEVEQESKPIAPRPVMEGDSSPEPTPSAPVEPSESSDENNRDDQKLDPQTTTF